MNSLAEACRPVSNAEHQAIVARALQQGLGISISSSSRQTHLPQPQRIDATETRAVRMIIGEQEVVLTRDSALVLLSALRNALQPNMNHGTIIRQCVAEYYQLTTADIDGRARPEAVVIPRQVTMYMLRVLLNKPLNEVGMICGGKDHGTVLHAIKRVEERMWAMPSFRHDIEQIEAAIKIAIEQEEASQSPTGRTE